MDVIQRKIQRSREANEALRSARAFISLADTFFTALPGIMATDPNYEHTRPQLIAAATNLAFGVELHLKTFLIAAGSKVPSGSNGHNLLALFEALPADFKASLEVYYNQRIVMPAPLHEVRVYITSQGEMTVAEKEQEEAKLTPGNDIRSVLQSERDAFKIWRYFYEASTKRTALYRIKVHALYAIANAIGEHFRPPSNDALSITEVDPSTAKR
jgi:hypothetical protein